MAQAKRRPNYTVKHREGWEVKLYLPRTLIKGSNSKNEDDRANSRTIICALFRDEAKAQYAAEWPGYELIEWDDLSKPFVHIARLQTC